MLICIFQNSWKRMSVLLFVQLPTSMQCNISGYHVLPQQGCHCQLDARFKDFSGHFRTFSSKLKDLYNKAYLFFLLIQQWASQDLFLWKNRSSVYVSKHCYIKRIMSGYDKQLILITLGGWRWKSLSISGLWRTTTQIQGLSWASNFLLPIPGLSRIFKGRGNCCKVSDRWCHETGSNP